MAILDIAFDGPWQDEVASVDLAVAALDAIAHFVPLLARENLIISILFTGDDRVRVLNREWRGKDRPTNVLSFPMLDDDDLDEIGPDDPPEMLGDIALAHGTCLREAAEKRIPTDDHCAHLIVHGLLHLVGYDHETSDSDAERMEALEIAALAKMGIADPYADRDNTGA